MYPLQTPLVSTSSCARRGEASGVSNAARCARNREGEREIETTFARRPTVTSEAIRIFKHRRSHSLL